jgi:hypothetical protein
MSTILGDDALPHGRLPPRQRPPAQCVGLLATPLPRAAAGPLALIPLSLATIVVVFGHQIEDWMIANADHELRYIVLVFWRIVRWSIALLTSVTVLTALYHFGTSHKEHWSRVAPGAIAATFLWFPATLAFGFYVTRIADYTMFYGSFGAGIATLVWLYLTAFSVLVGAELNAQRSSPLSDRLPTPSRSSATWFGAGLDVVRLNFSHGTPRREAELDPDDPQGLREERKPLCILGDLQGPKIRTGKLKDHKPVQLVAGGRLTITPARSPGPRRLVGTTFKTLAENVEQGSRILLSDGLIELRVTKSTATT